MSKIIITIEIPDGATVSTNSGGGAASKFVPAPDPEYPDRDCPQCGASGAWRMIKGGLSKTKFNPDGTRRQFNSFYVCGVDGCDGKDVKPVRARNDESSAVEDVGF